MEIVSVIRYTQHMLLSTAHRVREVRTRPLVSARPIESRSATRIASCSGWSECTGLSVAMALPTSPPIFKQPYETILNVKEARGGKQVGNIGFRFCVCVFFSFFSFSYSSPPSSSVSSSSAPPSSSSSSSSSFSSFFSKKILLELSENLRFFTA